MNVRKFNTTIIFTVFALCAFISFNLFAGKTDEGEKHIEVDFTISCVECHADETPEQVKEWQSSAHGLMNFGCYMCHGDGEEEYYPSPDSDRCISCHSDQEVDFEKSKHKSCFDCHSGHSLKFH